MGGKFSTLNSLFETRFTSQNGVISAPIDQEKYNQVLMTRLPMSFWSDFEYRDGVMWLRQSKELLSWLGMRKPPFLKKPYQVIPTQVELFIRLLCAYAPHLGYSSYGDLSGGILMVAFKGDLKQTPFPEPIHVSSDGTMLSVRFTGVNSAIEKLSQV